MPDRVMVFIDSSNLYRYLIDYCQRSDLDYRKFSLKLAGDWRLIRTYLYDAALDQSKEPPRFLEQQKFHAFIRRIPYTELRTGGLIYRNWPQEPPYQKGVDVLLASDCITHAFHDNYDVMILVSNDTDFVAAVQAVKEAGKQVQVALWGSQRTSAKLRDVADDAIVLSESYLSDCWK